MHDAVHKPDESWHLLSVITVNTECWCLFWPRRLPVCISRWWDEVPLNLEWPEWPSHSEPRVSVKPQCWPVWAPPHPALFTMVSATSRKRGGSCFRSFWRTATKRSIYMKNCKYTKVETLFTTVYQTPFVLFFFLPVLIFVSDGCSVTTKRIWSHPCYGPVSWRMSTYSSRSSAGSWLCLTLTSSPGRSSGRCWPGRSPSKVSRAYRWPGW